MSGALVVQNRQRDFTVRLPLFRQILRCLLLDLLACPRFELGVYLLEAAEMAQLNQSFLGHDGPTDVITFDYAAPGSGAPAGEIMLCPTVAWEQARRFRTIWQSELVRYAVHGILHLRGFDDRTAAARRVMKREENRWLRALAARFSFRKLGRRRLRL